MTEYALSVRQPWAHAIMFLGKDVENRGWSTDHRGRLWIHASTIADRSRPGLMRKAGEEGPLVSGALLGYVDLVAIHHSDDCGNACSSWAVTKNYHWELRGPVVLREPVKAKGKLRLWTLPMQLDPVASTKSSR